MVWSAQMDCLVPRAQQEYQVHQVATARKEIQEIQVVMALLVGLDHLAGKALLEMTGVPAFLERREQKYGITVL